MLRAWVMAAVITLPTAVQVSVLPLHDVKCQLAAGVAVTVTLLLSPCQAEATSTAPAPLVPVASQ